MISAGKITISGAFTFDEGNLKWVQRENDSPSVNYLKAPNGQRWG